jgi:hypothetical protein
VRDFRIFDINFFCECVFDDGQLYEPICLCSCSFVVRLIFSDKVVKTDELGEGIWEDIIKQNKN